MSSSSLGRLVALVVPVVCVVLLAAKPVAADVVPPAPRPAAEPPPPPAPSADAKRVAAVILPSRSAEAAARGARMRELGRALAAARGASLGDDEDGAAGASAEIADLSATLARAQELAAGGQLDEAARLLDDAIEAAARTPHRFATTPTLVAAHVSRAAIALARGESARAEVLLARLLRWDPTFDLAADERAPRLVTALAAVRGRLGEAPALAAADLGSLCAQGELLVARPLPGARTEVLRLVGCRVVASVRVREIDAAVLATLGIATPPTGGRRTDDGPRPLWRRPWVWAIAGAVLVGTGALVWWQVGEEGGTVDVVPRL